MLVFFSFFLFLKKTLKMGKCPFILCALSSPGWVNLLQKSIWIWVHTQTFWWILSGVLCHANDDANWRPEIKPATFQLTDDCSASRAEDTHKSIQSLLDTMTCRVFTVTKTMQSEGTQGKQQFIGFNTSWTNKNTCCSLEKLQTVDKWSNIWVRILCMDGMGCFWFRKAKR